MSNKWVRNLGFCSALMLVLQVSKPHPLTPYETFVVSVAFVLIYSLVWLNNTLLYQFWLPNGHFFKYFSYFLPVFVVLVSVHWWAKHNISFIGEEDKWNLIGSVLTCLLALLIGFGFNSAYREIINRQSSLETELLAKRNELRFLQNQVNPHFLFNSLNNLYSASIAEPSKVSDYILQMADLLRYQLSTARRELVPLAEEVAFLQNYMDIESRRLGQQIELSTHVAGDFKQKNIAPLLFLPFLENAFKYATGGIFSAKIEVLIKAERDMIQFFVKNSLPQNVTESPVSTGIGILNAQKRLSLLYPNQFELAIIPTETTFLVDLKIKLPA